MTDVSTSPPRHHRLVSLVGLSVMVLCLLSSTTRAGVKPFWPNLGGIRTTARSVVNTKPLPEHVLTVASSMHKGLPGEYILYFPGLTEWNLRATPGRNGKFDLILGHLAGGIYPAVQVYLGDQLLGTSKGINGPARATVTRLRTPLLASHGVYLRIRPLTPGPFAFIHYDYQPVAFKPVPADRLTVAKQPEGAYLVTTFLRRTVVWAGLDLRVTVPTKSTLTVNGKQPYAVQATPSGTLINLLGHKLNRRFNQLTFTLPKSASPAAALKAFRLEASPDCGEWHRGIPAIDTPEINLKAWPRATIGNGRVKATVALPDAEVGFYRGPRFDPSSMIPELTCDRHSYFATNGPTLRNPLAVDHGAGPCEEFWEPQGYREAKVGEPFIKIGVGLLKKPFESGYFFSNDYRVSKPFTWTMEQTPQSLTFTQKVHEKDWAYHYQRIVRVLPDRPVLKIDYTLTNTGQKRITTSQYAHNFIQFDGHAPDNNYRIHYPTRVSPLRKIEGGVVFEKGTTFTPGQKTAFIPLTGLKNSSHNNVLISQQNGPSLRVIGDFPPFRSWLFINQQVTCPEMFIFIDLKPGESKHWSRTYDMSAQP